MAIIKRQNIVMGQPNPFRHTRRMRRRSSTTRSFRIINAAKTSVQNVNYSYETRKEKDVYANLIELEFLFNVDK
ncbi:hypothetical protein Hanom_Chr02g00096521 [Helianthus anomalus]